MNVQIRTTGLSGQQKALEVAYYACVDILRDAGFNAEYIKCFAPEPTDNPGHIRLDFGGADTEGEG
jgi:hypothetical protein